MYDLDNGYKGWKKKGKKKTIVLVSYNETILACKSATVHYLQSGSI